MGDFMQSSVWMKVALVCLSLGTLLFIIGFSTGSWMVYSGRNTWRREGLWTYNYCDNRRCVYGDSKPWYNLDDGRDFHRAAQALEVIGLILDLIALLILLLYMCAVSLRRRNNLIAVIVLIFAAVFFIVVGIAVFAIKLDSAGYEVGWSMGFAIVGAIFVFISGIMCILQLIGR